MTLRDKVLARIREERERCEKATPGPWTYRVEPNDRQTGSAHYTVQNPTFDGPCPCGGRHPPGKLICWLAGGLGDSTLRRDLWRHDPSIEADASFIASARTLLPALLSEAERQVVEHEPGIMRDAGVCCGCADPTRPEDCPVISGWARVFGIEDAGVR